MGLIEKGAVLRSPLYLLLAVVYLGWTVFSGTFFQALFGFLLLLAVLLAFPLASRSNILVSGSLYVLGIILLFFSGGGPAKWLLAFTSNGGLVALFIALPLYNILLDYNDYVGAMEKLFHLYVRQSWWFFTLASVFAGFLGAVMNLGGMTLMHQLLRPYQDHYGNDIQMAQALSRGNLSMSYWAPCHMSVATVVTYTGISWLALAPKGVLLSLFQLPFIAVFFYIAGGKKGRQQIAFADPSDAAAASPGAGSFAEAKLPRQDKQALMELLAVYGGLVALVALLNHFTSLPVLAIISLSAFIYPPFIAMIKGKGRLYQAKWQKYKEKTLGGVVNQVVMFSSVGFFGKAIEYSGIGEYLINKLLPQNPAHPSLAVMMIAFLFLILALLGIHPVITIIALAAALRPEVLALSPLDLAYTYLLGYSVAVTTSPFFAVGLTISALNGLNPWEGMARHNIIYSIFLILVFAQIIPRI